MFVVLAGMAWKLCPLGRVMPIDSPENYKNLQEESLSYFGVLKHMCMVKLVAQIKNNRKQ